MLIYHIVPADKWSSFAGTEYRAESLALEGFIHCSFAEQIDAVIERYYQDVSALTVLAIDPSRLRSKLVVEPSTGGENYPHIYGPINVDAIVDTVRRE